ncbi:splicing regulator SDE2-like [Anopheles cruzii]|uniref:splicing regulator SDE2-like n=1 Tax=Anopheles cruzii TaxID=68878 RepID=UPI0022EC82FF|nr:splicing regulator SDE2-like [Anopheles cruzii]
MYTLYYGNELLQMTVVSSIVCEIPSAIKLWKGLAPADYYITQCGQRIDKWQNLRSSAPLRINERLTGGKGGFGSMLRAIGAQIEKTTNRDACRDLSGRRLRDINEEKRLKACTTTQQHSSKNDH